MIERQCEIWMFNLQHIHNCLCVFLFVNMCLDELHLLMFRRTPSIAPLSLFICVGEEFEHACGRWSDSHLENRGNNLSFLHSLLFVSPLANGLIQNLPEDWLAHYEKFLDNLQRFCPFGNAWRKNADKYIQCFYCHNLEYREGARGAQQ